MYVSAIPQKKNVGNQNAGKVTADITGMEPVDCVEMPARTDAASFVYHLQPWRGEDELRDVRLAAAIKKEKLEKCIATAMHTCHSAAIKRSIRAVISLFSVLLSAPELVVHFDGPWRETGVARRDVRF